MRISDWSSDVCSSDLNSNAATRVCCAQRCTTRMAADGVGVGTEALLPRTQARRLNKKQIMRISIHCNQLPVESATGAIRQSAARRRVVTGKGVSGSVELGERGTIKKHRKRQNN